MLTVTADLIGSDDLMSSSSHNAGAYQAYSPQGHGAIGDPSPVPSPLPDGTMYHHPSSIYAPSQSQLGRSTPLSQSTYGHTHGQGGYDVHGGHHGHSRKPSEEAELDISNLLAQAQKQHEADKASVGSTFTFGGLGNGVFDNSGLNPQAAEYVANIELGGSKSIKGLIGGHQASPAPSVTGGNGGNGGNGNNGNLTQGANVGTTGTGAIGPPPGLSEKFIHHRPHNSEVWDRFTTKLGANVTNIGNVGGGINRPSSIHPPLEGVLALSASVPKTAPAVPLFQPFSDDVGSLGSSPGSAQNVHSRQSSMPLSHTNPAEAITTHLQALSHLIGPFISTTEEIERLKKEVGIWKGEWNKAERERRRVQGLLESGGRGGGVPAGGHFSAVLIDGDHLIFEDRLLSQGYTGGQQAATLLLTSLPELLAHIESSGMVSEQNKDLSIKDGFISDIHGPFSQPGQSGSGEDSMEWLTRSRMISGNTTSSGEREIGTVVVQVFMNKLGLSTALIKAGSSPNAAAFESFWQGFSAAHELITVIDIGAAKEASGAKIRDFLKLYSRNAQCDMILLGAIRDEGYAHVLAASQTDTRMTKLLLLKGNTDPSPQLRQHASRVVSIPQLFRSNRLIGTGTVPGPIAIGSSAMSPPAVSGSAQSFSSVVQQPPRPRSVTPVTPLLGVSIRSNAETSSTGSVEMFDWQPNAELKNSKLGKKGVKATAKEKKSLYKERQLQEMDKSKEKEPDTDSDGWKEAGAKKGNRKLLKKGVTVNTTVRNLRPRPCHAFYLGPSDCRNADDCEYGHHYKLNASQLDELAKLAKENLCPYVKNNKCRFGKDCVYGHQCPRMDDCTFGNTCRFRILPNGHGEFDNADDSD